jgi:hypothetical protein
VAGERVVTEVTGGVAPERMNVVAVEVVIFEQHPVPCTR